MPPDAWFVRGIRQIPWVKAVRERAGILRPSALPVIAAVSTHRVTLLS